MSQTKTVTSPREANHFFNFDVVKSCRYCCSMSFFCHREVRVYLRPKKFGRCLTHCLEAVGKLSCLIATVETSKAAIHGPRRLNSWPLNGAILLSRRHCRSKYNGLVRLCRG
jgi:hypothetical protein